MRDWNHYINELWKFLTCYINMTTLSKINTKKVLSKESAWTVKKEKEKNYIPHHAVFIPVKDATKVRIVYDDSAKTKKRKLKQEWMSVQRTSYSQRSLWNVVEISNEKNWNHWWYRKSIFTNSPSTEGKKRHQILMVKGYKTSSTTQKPSYLPIHKNTIRDHIEPFLY